MTDRQKAREIIRKLNYGNRIEEEEMTFCKRNRELFEKFRFKKVRRADKKWQLPKLTEKTWK